jgi:hypothetical protein
MDSRRDHVHFATFDFDSLGSAEKIFRTADKKSRIGTRIVWTFLSGGGSVEISAVNRNLEPLDVASATPAKHMAQSRDEDNQVVPQLDRQAAQTVIQVVGDEAKPVQSESLPEDILQLGEVVNQPEGGSIR